MTQSKIIAAGSSRHAKDRLRRLFAIAFTLSGFAALAYQIVWQRVLTQVIGSDAISVVLIVAIFMIWLGVGAELSRRLLRRRVADAGMAYAVLEAAVGIAGIVSIPVLRGANAWFATTGIDSVVADFGLNLVLLAPPVIGMGMTTPLIVEVAKNELADLGRTVGRFYGLNILGAAIGALATGLVLIELLGLWGVTVLAATVNITVGLVTFLALRRSGTVAILAQPTSQRIGGAHLPISFAAAAVLFGFGTLALQIVFFRVLSNYFTQSTIVFPIVLCVYLLLMSAGQALGGRLADRYSDRLPHVIAALFASGALLLLAAMRFPPKWAARLGALSFTDFNGQLVSDTFPQLIGDPSPPRVFVFSCFFMLAVTAWAALFPVMLRLLTSDIALAGNRFAVLYSLYTVGNVAGAFVSGIVFFDLLGTGGTASATIALTGLGALLVSAPWGRGRGTFRTRYAPAVLLALSACAALLVPWHYYKGFRLGRYRVADVFEGRNGVATVVPTKRFFTIVDMNRTASASALNRDPGPDDSYEAWRWNHTELFALDPAFRPKRILVIGIGHAYLIDALLDLPFVEKITVVDLSKEIVDAVRAHTLTSTRRIFTDPRVNIVIADGRRFVQKALARGERYDLIQNKINEPWHAGSGNLFTIEFLRAERRLLVPGGYLGLRPLVGHIVDGLKVFESVIWPGYYHMFLKNGRFERPAAAHVTSDIRTAWFRTLPGREPARNEREKTLSVVVFQCCAFGAGVLHNTDDRPTFEYYWLSQRLGTWHSPRTNLWDLKFSPEAIPIVYD